MDITGQVSVRGDDEGPAPMQVDAPRHGSLERDRTTLFDLGQLDVRWDEARDTLWTFMTPSDRPNFNPSMLRDFQVWQTEIQRLFTGHAACPKYLVLGSRFPGVFNFGGDLELFSSLILTGNRQGLVEYGCACVRLLYNNMHSLNLPMITVGLVQGDALGGGFEALLSFQVVIAERGSRFGLPETAFGLFPGMGAHCFLARKVGLARMERMVLSGEVYSAEEMYELGIVHVIAEPGQGEAVAAEYIAQNRKRQSSHLGVYRASRLVDPLTIEELENVVNVWADAALKLTENQLKVMRRLASAQTRLATVASAD